jgi:hypothetical protein
MKKNSLTPCPILIDKVEKSMLFRNSLISLCCVLAFASVASAEESEHEKNKKMFAPIIVTTVINSSEEKVWDVMLDFQNYARWNPWVDKLDGEAKLGSRVKAHGKMGNSTGTLDLQITTMKKPNSLCWVDVTWFTHFGLGGWRCRTVEAIPDGKVKLTNHFEFTGIFGFILDSMSRENLEKGMLAENEGLRDFVERM